MLLHEAGCLSGAVRRSFTHFQLLRYPGQGHRLVPHLFMFCRTEPIRLVRNDHRYVQMSGLVMPSVVEEEIG